jgi:hypothetical protein
MAPICGNPQKVLHFRTAHVVKAACVFAVAAYAVSRAADLAGNVVQMKYKPLPLRGYAGARLARVTRPYSRDEQPPTALQAWGVRA